MQKMYQKFINIVIILTIVLQYFDNSTFFSKETMNVIITIIFIFDYGYNIIEHYRKNKNFQYLYSFGGIIDLLAIISLNIFKIFRLAKIFKISGKNQIFRLIIEVIKEQKNTLFPLLGIILMLLIFFGYVMYTIESPTNEMYNNLFNSTYGVFISITTVGFGDIYPKTELGKLTLGLAIVIGHSSFVAIPTIFSVALINKLNEKKANNVNKKVN